MLRHHRKLCAPLDVVLRPLWILQSLPGEAAPVYMPEKACHNVINVFTYRIQHSTGT